MSFDTSIESYQDGRITTAMPLASTPSSMSARKFGGCFGNGVYGAIRRKVNIGWRGNISASTDGKKAIYLYDVSSVKLSDTLR